MQTEDEKDRPEPETEKKEEILKNKSKGIRKSDSPRKNPRGKKTSLKKGGKKTCLSSENEEKKFSKLEERAKRLSFLFSEMFKFFEKKVSEFKNSNLMDSSAKVLHKTTQEVLRKKDEIMRIHKLNSSIASARRHLEHHTLSMGNKVVELIEDQKIDPTLSNGLDHLFNQIQDLKQEILRNEEELNKILND